MFFAEHTVSEHTVTEHTGTEHTGTEHTAPEQSRVQTGTTRHECNFERLFGSSTPTKRFASAIHGFGTGAVGATRRMSHEPGSGPVCFAASLRSGLLRGHPWPHSVTGAGSVWDR
jgi:hypothetical protein